ncbi:hypothetical protein AAFN60_18840 [Roseibacillus persicicus]|uniref:hypothetical protein n=1 Tax=Roseibacillus persicicus TaxID=454148 RepID=UPI00398BBABF
MNKELIEQHFQIRLPFDSSQIFLDDEEFELVPNNEILDLENHDLSTPFRFLALVRNGGGDLTGFYLPFDGDAILCSWDLTTGSLVPLTVGFEEFCREPSKFDLIDIPDECIGEFPKELIYEQNVDFEDQLFRNYELSFDLIEPSKIKHTENGERGPFFKKRDDFLRFRAWHDYANYLIGCRKFAEARTIIHNAKAITQVPPNHGFLKDENPLTPEQLLQRLLSQLEKVRTVFDVFDEKMFQRLKRDF